MSEVPVLRDALRDTARRHVARRRRRRRTAWIAVPAAVAMLLFVAVGVRGTDDPPVQQEITATPTPSATTAPSLADAERELAKTYGVLRRSARASDRPPATGSALLAGRFGEAYAARARRLATLGPRAVYIVPILYRGRVGLCLTTRVAPGRPGGAGCGPFEPARVMTKPMWIKTTDRGGPVYALLLPDGVDRVNIHLNSGTTLSRRVQENGLLYQGRGVSRFSWRDANGNEYSTRASI